MWNDLAANSAAEICRTSEDLTPEDRDAELLPIAVQQLYVLICQGKSQEAESILEEISIKEYAARFVRATLTQTASPNCPPEELARTMPQ